MIFLGGIGGSFAAGIGETVIDSVSPGICSLAWAHARELLSGKYEVDSPNLPLAFLANIRYNNICAKKKRRSDNVSDNDT